MNDYYCYTLIATGSYLLTSMSLVAGTVVLVIGVLMLFDSDSNTPGEK